MRVKVSGYKKSIHQIINIDPKYEAIIWDFYVTRSFANSASQKRKVSDFEIKQIPINEMIAAANIAIDDWKIITCSSMNNTMKDLDLLTSIKGKDKKREEKGIDIDRHRLCCLWPFRVSEDLSINGRGSKAECLLTHIRNAFAHGNTYFFNNGNVLLEDMNGNIKTAMILISTENLIDWIKLIDAKHIVYPELTK